MDHQQRRQNPEIAELLESASQTDLGDWWRGFIGGSPWCARLYARGGTATGIQSRQDCGYAVLEAASKGVLSGSRRSQ